MEHRDTKFAGRELIPQFEKLTHELTLQCYNLPIAKNSRVLPEVRRYLASYLLKHAKYKILLSIYVQF